MKLLLDENLSLQQSVTLRNLGHDALAVVEAGLAGELDPVIRAFAIETGRVLVTLDADFADMLRFPTADTPGVIRLKVHPPTEPAIRDQILKTVAALGDREIRGCLSCVPQKHRSDSKLLAMCLVLSACLAPWELYDESVAPNGSSRAKLLTKGKISGTVRRVVLTTSARECVVDIPGEGGLRRSEMMCSEDSSKVTVLICIGSEMFVFGADAMDGSYIANATATVMHARSHGFTTASEEEALSFLRAETPCE